MAFVQAKWRTPTGGRQIDVLVVHSMEYPEKGSSAEDIADYFARGDRRASAHACVDVNSRVDCVRDQDVAWAAPGANHDGLHLELAGYARQTRDDWLDAYSAAMISGPAAAWVREKADRYMIPLRFLRAEDLIAGRRGVTTHNEVRVAFGQTSHTDPGPWFPMGVLLDAAGADAQAPPADTPEDTVTDRICLPSWAQRDPQTARAPFFRVDPKPSEAGKGNWCMVLAFNGAKLARVDGLLFGLIPYTEVARMAAPAMGLAEIESTGAVVVLGEDGGVIDVARRP